jgi:diguanylate cyclase (GGDEF)-like protein
MTPIDAEALLDAIPDSAAVVGPDGTIVAINRAWRSYSAHNGGASEETGLGVNYVDVCGRSAQTGCTDAAEVGKALVAVLSGDCVECDLEYPCPSEVTGNRWFQLRITQLGGAMQGALITHVNISRRKSAEEKLARKAAEDPLTGLANRNTFADRVESALSLRTVRAVRADVGLLYIDLDGFKAVNDTYGHAAGDDVLRDVADRLRRVTRAHDTVARLGGDEFAVLMPRIGPEGLDALVTRVMEVLSEPHVIHGLEVGVGPSVGAYLASRGESPADALDRADAAMYHMKHRRRLRGTDQA